MAEECLNEARFNLVVVICFGVASGVLLTAGMLALFLGFDAGVGWGLIVFGVGLCLATAGLAAEFGFMSKGWF